MQITPTVLKQIVEEGVRLALAGVIDDYQLNLENIREAVHDDVLNESLEVPVCPDCGQRHVLDEAKKHPPLGKVMRGDVKKFKVYVKDKRTGNVKKVNFGDPNMEIRRDNPKARKSFRARHGCGTARASDRTKAAYWSCRMWSKKPVSKIVGGK